MKQLFLIFHGRFPSEKAAALFAAKSVEAFHAEGYDVTLLAPRRLGRAKSPSLPVVYVPTLDLFNLLPSGLAFRLSLFFFSVSTYVYLLFFVRRSALVYSNESLPLVLATFSFPKTVYELHDYPEHNHWFYRVLFNRVTGVLVTNTLKRTRLESDFQVAKEKLLVETNAVSLSDFSISLTCAEAREKLGLPLNAKIIVYTGHLYRWKGVETLCEAAKALSGVEIYIVGGTAEDLANYQKRYDTVPNLHFVGYRPHIEIPLWQKAADVLVLPNTAREQISAEYTSPMKLFEYMASGTPIVASRLPSIVEVVGESGALFVAPDDPRALARGLQDTLVDPRASSRSSAARSLVESHTWSARAKRILSWYSVLPDRSEAFRHERTIFYGSLTAAVLFILLFVGIHGLTPSFDSLQSDSYLGLATSLYERGVFTLSTTTPYLLQVTQSPGYPLFLAVTAAPWGSVLPALILQAILLASTAIFLYRLFAGTFSPRVRFWGALFFGMEPYTVYTAASPLSEALFLFLFIGGLLLLRRAYEHHRAREFFVAGIVFGCSILVRPIAEYIVPIVMVCGLVFALVRRYPRALAFFCCLVAGVVVCLLPWAYRNYAAFGVWTLSVKGPYSLYFFDAAEIIKYRDHLSATGANEYLVARAHATFPKVLTADDLRSPRYASFLTHETFSIIKESPGLFVKMYVASLGTFFLSDGYRLMWYEMSGGAITLPNITHAIVSADVRMVGRYFLDQPTQAALFFVGFFFWAITLLLAVFGSVRGLFLSTTHVRIAVLASIVFIAYFALVTGPLAQARYRIVATPFLFMIASYGASLIISRLYAHR